VRQRLNTQKSAQMGEEGLRGGGEGEVIEKNLLLKNIQRKKKD